MTNEFFIGSCKIGTVFIAAQCGDFADFFVGVHQIMFGGVAAQAVEVIHDAGSGCFFETAAYVRR